MRWSRSFLAATIFAGLAAALPAQQKRTSDSAVIGDGFFAKKLFPIMKKAQCPLCHSDNGVASGTRLEFPRPEAEPEEVKAFGLRLVEFVDPDHPQQSLLFRKPTNRLKHTGGERIPPGSEEEEVLRIWVERLASLSEKQRAAAEEGDRSKLAAHHSVMRRLTHRQYNNTVRDLLGDQTRPANQFPPEDFIHGFKNQTEGQTVPPLLAEAYGQAAEKLARNAFRGGDHNDLVPCEPVSPNDATCRDKFLRRLGLRAFRRPLTADELQNYAALFAAEAERTEDFLKGAQIVVEAMLQSPNFLFHTELGPQGPWYDYEVVSRLSYFLWNTMPSDDLFRKAAEGELVRPEDIEATARRMLEDPKAKTAMEEFLAQWLRFDRVLTTIRDRRLYREFNSELAATMTEETRRLFNHLVWEDKNFMEFFKADYSFLSSDLASLYGLPEPETQFAKVEFPADFPRAGVLGQAMFQTVTSKPSDTSPTERGLYIREHFLCHNVPPPPPGLNATLPPLTDEKPMTNRERLQVHLTNESCASCHRLIDPIGFGFEKFDAIGRHREKHMVKIFPTRDEVMKKLKTEATEYELELDTSAEVAGISDSEFSSPKELGHILAKTESCQKCIVKQLFRYAFGRQETAADQPAIDRALRIFQDSQFQFKELMVALVTSRPFLGGHS